MAKHEVIASIGDDDRAAKLGGYFRDYLSGWLAQVIPGLISGYSEKVMRELALFGMSCAAESVEEAIGKVVASALKTRRKYGWSETANG